MVSVPTTITWCFMKCLVELSSEVLDSYPPRYLFLSAAESILVLINQS